MNWWILIPIIAIVISFIAVFIMKSQLKSVRHRHDAADYVIPGSFDLTYSRDVFLYRNVTRTPKPQNDKK